MIGRVLGRGKGFTQRAQRTQRAQSGKKQAESISNYLRDGHREDGMDIKEIVKEKYGHAALRGKSGSCCGTAGSNGSTCDPLTSNLYDAAQRQEVPGEALQPSPGWWKPTGLAKLNPAEICPQAGSGRAVGDLP